MSETKEENTTQEKKKNKKPLIIGGVLGGVAVVAIGAIVLSSNGTLPIPTPTPTEKPYITAVINGKEYMNPKTVSIVDGKEVSDIAKLAELTDANKEAYICSPTFIGQMLGGVAADPNLAPTLTLPDQAEGMMWNKLSEGDKSYLSLPTLYWSNVVEVPTEYQTDKPQIVLAKPAEIKTGNDIVFITVNGYGYTCGFVGGLANPVDKLINETTYGVWNEETQQTEKKPLPEAYNNWYSQARIITGGSFAGESDLTTKLPFSKWVQMNRMGATAQNQKEYIKGFNAGNSAEWLFTSITPEQKNEQLNKQLSAPYWVAASPEAVQSFKDGFEAYFVFAAAPANATIPALPAPIVDATSGTNGQPANGEPILVEGDGVAVPTN